MINPALLKALIPQDVMENVQNAAQAFIHMKESIERIELELFSLNRRLDALDAKESERKIPNYAQQANFEARYNAGRLPPDNGNGTE